MPQYTPNLNLYNTDMDTDGNLTFNFQRDINDNNDKIDAFAGDMDTALNSKTDVSLDNLNSAGQAILDNKLNKQMITNCLTEIPQKIKLELNNGTLTLKAGSKVIVPNGFESDGVTPKFDEVEITEDYSDTRTGVQRILYYHQTDHFTTITYGRAFSNNTQPPEASAGTYCYWYDLANNIIKFSSNNGGTWSQGHSLPICIATPDANGFASIDQIFNGIGYIGSTVWVDKGVKGLIPDGRNADGSLKNIEFETDKVCTRDMTLTGNKNLVFCPYRTTGYFVTLNNSVYNETLNLQKESESSILQGIDIATCKLTSGVISNFQQKNTFHAIDYNDNNLSQVDGQWVNNHLVINNNANKNIGTYVADLSAYLPNDNYNYEVDINLYAYQNSSASNAFVTVYSSIMGTAGTTTSYAQLVLNSAAADVSNNRFTIPIGLDRTISYTIYGVNLTSAYFRLLGYRRIGTNN